MKPPMYPSKTMYKIGNGTFSDCSFDFSVIPIDQYTPLFNTFPTFLVKKIESISFTCNFEYQYAQLGRKSEKREEIITNSIANNKPKFIEYLLKIMKIVLPSTRTLKRIEFCSMRLNRKIIPRIFSALVSCPSLEIISFKNVQICDDQFIKFLGSLSPYKIQELKFVSCGLTNRSTPAIVNFINRNPKKGEGNRALKRITIDSLPERDQKEINDTVVSPNVRPEDETTSSDEIETITVMSEMDKNDKPQVNKKVLLSHMLQMSSDDDNKKNVKKTQSEEIFNELIEQKRRQQSQQDQRIIRKEDLPHDEEEQKSESEEIESIDSIENEPVITDDDEKLAEQNEMLRKRLKYLLHKMNGAQYADDIFLIGPQAKDLVEVIPEMRKKIEDFEALNQKTNSPDKKRLN